MIACTGSINSHSIDTPRAQSMDNETLALLRELRTDISAILARLDVPAQAVTAPALPRASYTRKEFAALTGRSANTLKHPRYWRALGGKRVGGRVMFSEAARLALANDRDPTLRK